MFGFTLSWDEIARTSQAIGDVNTLPLELQGLTATVTTPAIYALGTVTTVVSLLVMGLAVAGARCCAARGKGAHERCWTPLAAPSRPPRSATEMYERIVSAMLDHRLPGTKLVEDKLATAFGVSRTRIRPVLVRLANEQVVTLTPNRGATIAQPTEQEAREVFGVRR
jgi:hypothetical protein